MKTAPLVLLLILGAGLLGFALGAKRDERQAVLEADRDFDRATAETGVDGWVSYFAEDGRMVGSTGTIIQGPKAVREAMEPLLSSKSNSLRWQPEFAEVSQSGDLAYTIGASRLRAKDPSGNLMERDGRYVTIWRKYQGGKWKVALDIGANGPARPVR